MSNVLELKECDDTGDNDWSLAAPGEAMSHMLDVIEDYKIHTGESSYPLPALPRDVFMDMHLIIRNPINRNERRRLNKLKFLKKHNRTHDEIALFVVRKPIEVKTKDGDTYTIEPGIYLGNGNTRRLWYTENSNYTPKTKTLIATVHEVTSGEEYELLYDCYDSDDSVEKSAEKIQGVLSFMGVNVNSTKAKSGAFGSALSMAYGDWKASAKDRISTFKSEIELIDKVGMFDPEDKNLLFQAMLAMSLIVAKLYGTPEKSKERMISGLQFLASAKDGGVYGTLGDQKWDGLTAICYEVFNPGKKNWIPDGDLGATKGSSQAPQLDFFLYCFEKYMMSQKIDKTKGFKPANWKGKWEEISDLLDQSII